MLSYIITTLTLITTIITLIFLGFTIVLIGFKLIFEPVKGVCKCTTRLDGKVALVTGGNSGIGLETMRGLAKLGARVIIASRDANKSQLAISDIVTTTGNTCIEYRHLDLAKFSSVREFAKNFNRTEPHLDILVNNAGCTEAKGSLTQDGIDFVTQINYFGAFLLTNLLLEKLEASKPSRIVILSSVGHHFCSFDPDDIACLNSNRMFFFFTYARSKLLQIFWTKALAKRLPLGVTVNAVHPGVVRTDILTKLPAYWQKPVHAIIEAMFKTAKEGSQPVIHMCVAPELKEVSGGYYADCQPRRPRAIVNDDRLVDKIWSESLVLTKTQG